MSKHIPELRIYKHQDLISAINQLHINIKVHLFDIGDENFKYRHPKPTAQEMDYLLSRLISVIQQDSFPVRK